MFTRDELYEIAKAIDLYVDELNNKYEKEKTEMSLKKRLEAMIHIDEVIQVFKKVLREMKK